MLRTARLLVLSLLFAPGAAQGYAAFSQWEDGDTNLYVGNVSAWWASNVAQAAREWEHETAFDFHVKGNGLPACDRFESNIRLPADEQMLMNGVEFSDKLCGDDPLPEGVLAVVQAIGDDEGFLDRVGLIFNEDYSWNRYSGPVWSTEIDFYRVALHELGHFMGLDHETENAAIMQPIIGDLDSLQPDDIAGANSLYAAQPEAAPELTPVALCRAAQLKAASKLCKRQLACDAKRAKSLDAGKREACVAAAEAGFAASWDAAVAAGAGDGGCHEASAGTSMAPLVTGAAQAAMLEVGAGDPSDPGDRALRAKLLKQAASLCASDLGAWRKDVRRSNSAALTRALDKARGRFVSRGTKAIDKAETRGVRYDGAHPEQVSDPLELMANEVGAATAP